LPDAGPAAVVLPQGWQGPAFMVFDNFDVVMRWNRSINYALAVAQMAQQLEGGAALVAQAGEAGALSTAQVKSLQQALNELGFDAGPADGQLGPLTKTALRLYQSAQRLPADGYPAPSVLTHVEHTRAAAADAGRITLTPDTVDEPTGQP
jgi:membrane-bound lytic murein transglycosylase B